MHSILNLLLDRPKAWQYGLQDPATTIAEKMIEFHDYINLHIIYIGIIVIYFLYVIILTFNKDSYPKHWIKQFTHNSVLEIVWTLIPAFVLIVIALPSFKLLYIIEEIYNPLAVLKVIGHQWYWSYEYNTTIDIRQKPEHFVNRFRNIMHFLCGTTLYKTEPLKLRVFTSDIEDSLKIEVMKNIFLEKECIDLYSSYLLDISRNDVENLEHPIKSEISKVDFFSITDILNQKYINFRRNKELLKDYKFDSYMIPDNEINVLKGHLRLLSVDNIVKLPISTELKVLITSGDVLHSWAIPSFGVKVDACPGRLSQIPLTIKREGTFYGQCSEICGVNHGFMPIVISAKLY